jgi:protein Xni
MLATVASTRSDMRARLLVVDALNLIRRVYAATPEDAPEHEHEHEHEKGALEASTQSLRRALKATSPSHAVAVFDGEGPTWRHRLYPEYKAGRKPMPDALRRELGRYHEAFSHVGVSSVARPEVEADDVVATLATKLAASGGDAVILSTDKIFCQLVGQGIVLRDHFQNRELDRSYIINKLGVPPEGLVDLWALAGNATTNIPGVPKVGMKTAAKLVQQYETLEGVLEAASSIAGKLGESLRQHAERARMSRELAALSCDLDLGWNLKSFHLGTTPMTAVG